jgi:hypothetical protein
VSAGYPNASDLTIASVTPTICDLVGVPRPGLSQSEPLGEVLRAHKEASIPVVSRCLAYAPDAIGRHVFARIPDLTEKVLRDAPVAAGMRSVFPPKTPVCFASMLTGAPPEVHGIREYERPVLECDTIFDALIRAGKKPAIVSVKEASVDVIFRGRDMDYFSEPYDDEVTARVIELLDAGKHHFILAYHQEYDDVLHDSGAFCAKAIAAVERSVAAFAHMAGKARECWSGSPGMVAFAPDHGAHDVPGTGTGTHGDDIADDMEVIHFFGFLG